MPINLFDLLMAALLAWGVVRGRRQGFSREFLNLLKWLVLLFGCAAIYEPVGEMIAQYGAFDLLSAYLLTYLGAALVIFLFFSLVQRRLEPKLAGSDIFGRSEYYLGMGSGLVRFCCMLLMGLALLNARAFSPVELKSMEKFQEDAYGSNLFPNLHSLQVAIFEDSFAGAFVRNELGFLLIHPTSVNSSPDQVQKAARK